MATTFNGQRLVKPQAASKVDFSAIVDTQEGIGRNICIIGAATGGQPGVVQSFVSPSTANSTLISGDLLTAMQLAWSPSSNEAGASTINAIRINSAVASSNSSSFKDTSVSPVAVLQATAKDWGSRTNNFQVKVLPSTAKIGSLGTPIQAVRLEDVSDSAITARNLVFDSSNNTLVYNSGSPVTIVNDGTYTVYSPDGSWVKIVKLGTLASSGTVTSAVTIGDIGIKIQCQDASRQVSVESADNLGPVFTMRYTGTEACTVTIATNVDSDGVLRAKTLTTTVTGNSARNLSLDLSDARFDTAQEVVAFINAQTGYFAEISKYCLNSAIPSALFDAVSSTSIANVNLVVTAHLGCVIDWSQRLSSYVTFSKVAPTSIGRLSSLNSSAGSWISLTGGSEGTAGTTEWTAALALLEKLNIDVIIPITTNAALQALVKAHVDAMSLIKMERRAYYGHSIGEDISALKIRRNSFNDRRSMLLTPGIQLRDNDGNIKQYDSSFLAALVGGISVGFANVSTPLTYKYVNIVGLEKSYSSAEIDILLDAGIVPLEFVRNRGYRITQGRTTYTFDDRVVNVEDSASRTVDFISQDIRTSLEDSFVGVAATPSMLQSLKLAVTSKLQDYEKAGLIVAGIDPVTRKAVPAFQGITVEFNNRACYVSFQASIVQPLNFILITTSFKTAAITA